MKQLIDCRLITLERFKLERGKQPKHSLLFLLSGEIEGNIGGVPFCAGADTLVSFPDDVAFERRIVSPCELYYVRYENPDGDPLPVGVIEVEDTRRLTSTLQYLTRLSVLPTQLDLGNGFLADIFRQLEAQTLLSHIQNDPVIARVHRFFEQHLAEKITLSQIAQVACLSVSGLIYRFKKQAGVTPIDYLTAMRLARAEEYLTATTDSVAQIAAKCGFDNPYYFSNTFKKHKGASPTEYRRAHGI